MNKPLETKIFLNVDGQIFQDSNFIFSFTNRKLEKFGLLNEDIVLKLRKELTLKTMCCFNPL